MASISKRLLWGWQRLYFLSDYERGSLLSRLQWATKPTRFIHHPLSTQHHHRGCALVSSSSKRGSSVIIKTSGSEVSWFSGGSSTSLNQVALIPEDLIIIDDPLFDGDETDVLSLDQERVCLTNNPTTPKLEIPRQTLENAQKLFDSMAPHMTYRELLNMKARLVRFTKMCQQTESKSLAQKIFIDPYVSVIGRINAIINGDRVGSSSLGRPRKKKIVADPWITSLLAQFIVSTDYPENPFNTHLDITSKDPTFPPCINRVHFVRNVNLWIKAKELSLVTDLFTYKNLKSISSTNVKAEAEHLASLLADRLPTEIHSRIMELVIHILNIDAKKITHGVSHNNYRRRYGLPKDASNNEKGEGVQSKPLLFFSNMKTCSNLHTHLIFEDILNFFYPSTSKSPQDPSISGDNPNSLLKDSKLQNSWKRWMSLKKELSPVLMAAQHAYIDCCKNIDPPSNFNLHGEDDELLNIHIKEDKSSARERRESRRYVTFNTLLFKDFNIPSSYSITDSQELHSTHDIMTFDPKTLESPPTENTVFIENLPIDITEEELYTLYSRCGQLESIYIFNQRPALDPGETKHKSLLKSNRLSGFAASHRRFRLRSPVYALLKFQEKDGCRTATMDALRIFGMVVRRHAVRSIPSHTMTKLFIENISVGQRGSVIEEKLCEILFPFMRVYTEIGMDPTKDARNIELSFPSFESTYFAFSLLGKKHEDNLFVKDQVQWMKTPPNSMDYWTRKILIEP